MNHAVSIILPTYNGARTIDRAIASILAQNYRSWELIILSDGSTDDTKAVVEKKVGSDERIIFIENEQNMGIQKTLNKGLGLARGEYVARIDDDDEWIDHSKLAAQVAFLESHPDHVLVGTDAFVVDENGISLSTNVMPRSDAVIRSKMLSKNCFLHSTILVRKDIVKKVGGYSQKKRDLHAEDYNLWLRVGLEGRMANFEMKSTALTAHGNSLTSRNRTQQARNVLRNAYTYRYAYPSFFKGYFISVARLTFFYLMSMLPIPQSLWYRIQRAYRTV